jgi:hypothetical protein
MSFRAKQLLGLAGAVPGVFTVLLTWHYASSWFSFATLPADNPADRLVFVLRWLLIPGLTLLVGVWIAGRRAFTGTAGSDSGDGDAVWHRPRRFLGWLFNQSHGQGFRHGGDHPTDHRCVCVAAGAVNDRLGNGGVLEVVAGGEAAGP